MEDRAGIQASELKDLQEFRSGETIRKKSSKKKKMEKTLKIWLSKDENKILCL